MDARPGAEVRVEERAKPDPVLELPVVVALVAEDLRYGYGQKRNLAESVTYLRPGRSTGRNSDVRRRTAKQIRAAREELREVRDLVLSSSTSSRRA